MLTRWFDLDPFNDMTTLRDAMNQLFEQAVLRPGVLPSRMQGGFPVLMNVYELDHQYVVQAYLPGIDQNQLEVTAKQNTLTIKGRQPEPIRGEDAKKVTWLLQEVGGGEFTRSISLPKTIAGERVEAGYHNGLLSVTLPFAEHEMPKRIQIKSAGETVESLPSAQSQPELIESNHR